MSDLYIINDHEIHELVDLLCAIPPSLYDAEGFKWNKESSYINWSINTPTCWVEIFTDHELKQIKSLRSNISGDIKHIDYTRSRYSDPLQDTILRVLEWCAVTGTRSITARTREVIT